MPLTYYTLFMADEEKWWKTLPKEQAFGVLVLAKTDRLSPGGGVIREKIIEVSRQACARVVEFIGERGTDFEGVDTTDIGGATAFGVLSLELRPPQCDILLESGLVKGLIHNVTIDLKIL